MRVPLKALLLASVALLGLSAAPSAVAAESTVVVALDDYDGPEAYFSVYLVDPAGKYARTLWLSGPERVWWPDTKRWFGYFSRNPQDVDAITGASTAAGTRRVLKLDLDPAVIDAGYKIRVETSVEGGKNHQTDVEVDLTHANERVKTAGTGYVRYIRYKL